MRCTIFTLKALPDWDFLNLQKTVWLDPVSGQPRAESFLSCLTGRWPRPNPRWRPSPTGTPIGGRFWATAALIFPEAKARTRRRRNRVRGDFETLLDREVRARLGKAFFDDQPVILFAFQPASCSS